MVFASPAEARAQVDRDVELAQQRAVAAHAAKVAIDAVTGRAETRQGDVTVVVDSGGSIVTLDLTPQALARRPDDLSRAIVQTTRKAQAEVVTQVQGIAAATYGEGSPTTRRLQGQLAERFVAPEPEDTVDWGHGGRR